MTQYNFGDLESPLSGTTFINTHLEPWRNALHSTHSGVSRPAYALAAMLWMNIATTPWVLNCFDGTDDIPIGTINATTNTFTPSLGTFTSAALATALSDETGTGVAVFNTNPTFATSITAPLVYGSAASGGTLTLQSTSHATKGKLLFGTSAYDEVNNRLGIGTTSPSERIHVYGSSLSLRLQDSGGAADMFVQNNGTYSLIGNVGTQPHYVYANGAARTVVDSNGKFGINLGIGNMPTSMCDITVGVSAATKGMIVKGAASQSGSLAEFQNSSGTAFFTVGPDTIPGDGTVQFLNLTATMPATMTAACDGMNFTVTGNSTSNQQVRGFNFTLSEGTVTSNVIRCGAFTNTSAGTGGSFGAGSSTNPFRFSNGNLGLLATANGGASGTTGWVCAMSAIANGSSVFNLGAFIATGSTKSTPAQQTGAMITSGGGTSNTAAYIGLRTTGTPTWVHTALQVDNGASAVEIAVFQDNGTTKLSVADGGHLTFADAVNIAAGTTTGTKIGTATTQKLGFWNATPIVQPTTAIAAATFTANSGTAVNDASTFDGYTLGQVVKSLRNMGALA